MLSSINGNLVLELLLPLFVIYSPRKLKDKKIIIIEVEADADGLYNSVVVIVEWGFCRCFWASIMLLVILSLFECQGYRNMFVFFFYIVNDILCCLMINKLIHPKNYLPLCVRGTGTWRKIGNFYNLLLCAFLLILHIFLFFKLFARRKKQNKIMKNDYCPRLTVIAWRYININKWQTSSDKLQMMLVFFWILNSFSQSPFIFW